MLIFTPTITELVHDVFEDHNCAVFSLDNHQLNNDSDNCDDFHKPLTPYSFSYSIYKEFVSNELVRTNHVDVYQTSHQLYLSNKSSRAPPVV